MPKTPEVERMLQRYDSVDRRQIPLSHVSNFIDGHSGLRQLLRSKAFGRRVRQVWCQRQYGPEKCRMRRKARAALRRRRIRLNEVAKYRYRGTRRGLRLLRQLWEPECKRHGQKTLVLRVSRKFRSSPLGLMTYWDMIDETFRLLILIFNRRGA